MATYLLRRVSFILLTMLLASIVIFAATQLLPGDVAQVMLGQFATKEAVANLREELGLNRPALRAVPGLAGTLRTGRLGRVDGQQAAGDAHDYEHGCETRPCWVRLRCSSTFRSASCWGCSRHSSARRRWTRASRRSPWRSSACPSS